LDQGWPYRTINWDSEKKPRTFKFFPPNFLTASFPAKISHIIIGMSSGVLLYNNAESRIKLSFERLQANVNIQHQNIIKPGPDHPNLMDLDFRGYPLWCLEYHFTLAINCNDLLDWASQPPMASIDIYLEQLRTCLSQCLEEIDRRGFKITDKYPLFRVSKSLIDAPSLHKTHYSYIIYLIPKENI